MHQHYQAMSAMQLRSEAAFYADDNFMPGEEGYCSPALAEWRFEYVTPERLTNLFASAGEALAWLHEEVRMAEEEQLSRSWAQLLVESIEEPAILLVREGKVFVWDGWHRAAASLARRQALPAIVGYPQKLAS